MVLGRNYDFSSTQFYISDIMQRNIYSAPNVALSSLNKDSKIQVSEVKVNAADSAKYEYNVYFRDSFSEKFVSVGLSGENMLNLYNLFDISDFKKDSNGNVLLKGEAEKFVSGWFMDIAYKRGYVNADKNGDGFLDENERANTQSFFDITQQSAFRKGKNGNIIVDSITALGASPYQNGIRRSTQDILAHTSSTIEEELNKTLSRDKGGDKRIKMGDMLTKNALIEKMKLNSYAESKPLSFLLENADLEKLEEQIQEELEEELEKTLEKLGFSVSNIKADSNISKVFKKIMKNKSKEQLESLNDENALFKAIQNITKLDKKTLEKGLNSKNFEQNIISIVQEIVENVDNAYKNKIPLNSQINSQRLEINA